VYGKMGIFWHGAVSQRILRVWKFELKKFHLLHIGGHYHSPLSPTNTLVSDVSFFDVVQI
jgi:hypothetical protein